MVKVSAKTSPFSDRKCENSFASEKGANVEMFLGDRVKKNYHKQIPPKISDDTLQ